MKSIYRMLSCILLSTISLSSFAQQVDENEALARANNFFSSESGNTAGAKARAAKKAAKYSVAYTAKSKGNNDFYVINNSNGGFIIVSGDDRTDKQIFGYSSTGSFSYADAPDGLKDLFNDYSAQVNYLRTNYANSTGDLVAVDADFTKHIVIDYLVQSTWGQDTPYNNDCPSGTVCGCVATAMGQIMNYWKYPETPEKSTITYTTSSAETSVTCDYSSSFYDWDNIKDDYGYDVSTTSEEQNAVAKLIFDIGASVSMDYNTSANGGSGALTKDVPSALLNKFHYSTADCVTYRNYGSNDAWTKMLKNELDNKRPVYYAQNQHAFICDGYTDNDYFHFNFGWNGWTDGWYTLTTTNNQVADYVTSSETSKQAIINIHP